MEKSALNSFALLSATSLGANSAAIVARMGLFEYLLAWLTGRKRMGGNHPQQHRSDTVRTWPE